MIYKYIYSTNHEDHTYFDALDIDFGAYYPFDLMTYDLESYYLDDMYTLTVI